MGEVEDEHGIVGDAVPVDELLHDVVIGLERQDLGDDLNGELFLLREALDLRKLAEVAEGVGAVLGRRSGALPASEGVGVAPIRFPKPVHLPELFHLARPQVYVVLEIGDVPDGISPFAVPVFRHGRPSFLSGKTALLDAKRDPRHSLGSLAPDYPLLSAYEVS